MRHWPGKIKRTLNNTGIAVTRRSHWPPGSETECPKRNPCHGWDSDLVGEAHLWLIEWQRSHCGATPMELARNLPSRVPEKDVPGEVFHRRRITTKLPKGDAKGNRRPLTAPGHMQCRSQTVKKSRALQKPTAGKNRPQHRNGALGKAHMRQMSGAREAERPTRAWRASTGGPGSKIPPACEVFLMSSCTMVPANEGKNKELISPFLPSRNERYNWSWE